MLLTEPAVLAYATLYISALLLAVWRRRVFPLGDALAVMLIVGFGFTSLVYLTTPRFSAVPLQSDTNPTDLVFMLAYLGLVALLLTRDMPPWLPATWKAHFLKQRSLTVLYKLLVFVFIPLTALRVFWAEQWAELGFSSGDVGGQLRAATILILLLGGFNLLVGSSAAPIRARQFSGRYLLLGFGLAFAWNVVEVRLVEEFFFRAFIQTRLVNYLNSPAAGIGAASLLFGLAHAPGLYLRSADKPGPLGKHPSLLDSVLYSILALSPTGWFAGLLYWRTRKDPFADVWPVVEQQLQLTPQISAKVIFLALQQKYPGKFADGQLRTLQRRVRS